jgi:hypothetical protein
VRRAPLRRLAAYRGDRTLVIPITPVRLQGATPVDYDDSPATRYRSLPWSLSR